MIAVGHGGPLGFKSLIRDYVLMLKQFLLLLLLKLFEAKESYSKNITENVIIRSVEIKEKHMKLIIAKNYEEMSQISAQIVLSKTYINTRVNLSLTAGNTPARMYEILAEYVPNRDYFKHVHFYNFDEIVLKNEKFGLTMQELYDQFYTPCAIDKDNIHELDADNYQNYDALIESDGGLDLILIGIGADGHFCGNIPQFTKFENETYKIVFEEGSEAFKMVESLTSKSPTGEVVTFGPKTVMNAKQIVLIANGKHKAEIIKEALKGPVTTDVPSSILKLHPNLVVVLDADAASLL